MGTHPIFESDFDCLTDTMAAYIAKIDAYLRTPGPINDYCTLIEEKTKVQRKYIGLGGCIITMGLVFSTLAPLVVNLIAFIYPAYKSIKALESNDKDDDSKWLTYWVVYGFFSVMEFFADIILSWFPFYFIAKTTLFVWCMAPIKSNGSQFIYSHVILPWFLKNETKIDNAFNRGKNLVDQGLSEAEQLAKQAAADTLTSKND